MEEIVLASASPRRRVLLEQLGIPYRVVITDIDETADDSIDVREQTREIAKRKLLSAMTHRECSSAPWILAADTVIEFNGHAIGKPKDRADARRILLGFSDQEHQVVSACALYCRASDTIDTLIQISTVRFAPLSVQQIDWYLATEEWRGAAGGYRIQEQGACLIAGINGSWSGIVGLPLHEMYVMLTRNGYSF